jgi:oligosaccharide repeat unit polymerase
LTALVFFSFLYNSAKPVSILFFDSPVTPLVEPFIFGNILAALGSLGGIAFYQAVHGRFKSSGTHYFPIKNNLISMMPLCLVLGAALGTFAWNRYVMLDYNITNIFSAYGYEGGIGESNVFQVLSGQFGISAALYGFTVCYLRNRFNKRSTYVWLGICLSIAAFFLIRGSRNFAIMTVLPIAAILMYGRSIPVIKSLIIVSISFVAFQFLAYARNFGVNDLSAMSGLEVRDFAPDNSELVTSFNVYTLYDQIGHYYEMKYGQTYTVDALVNLVPRFLWRNRPYSISEDFTRVYLNSDVVNEGFGFSPMVEAIINFGFWGIPFVFFVAGYFICFLSSLLVKRGSYTSLLSWAMIIPFVINWNRIDFSTTSKMYLIFVSLFGIYDIVSTKYLLKEKRASPAFNSEMRVAARSFVNS